MLGSKCIHARKGNPSVPCVIHYIDGLMQERRNSIANALELRLSWINPSICLFHRFSDHRDDRSAGHPAADRLLPLLSLPETEQVSFPGDLFMSFWSKSQNIRVSLTCVNEAVVDCLDIIVIEQIFLVLPYVSLLAFFIKLLLELEIFYQYSWSQFSKENLFQNLSCHF